MKDNILLQEEFLSKADISQKLLQELEKAKIIKPAGITEDGKPFYWKHSLSQLLHIKGFVDMGYKLGEIQRIIKRIGFPKSTIQEKQSATLKKQLTTGELAEKAGVSPRTIKHWEDKGIIEPDMRSEGGFRLYSEIYIYLCNLIKDLQLFGYSLDQIKKISDLFRLFSAIDANIETYSKKETDAHLEDMLNEIDQLFHKMKLLKQGITRWEDLLGKKRKEINSFNKKNQKRVS